MSTKNQPTPYALSDAKWYRYWEEKGLFTSKPNPKKEPYTIILPPPNITGTLHMGHVLNSTLQDIVARRERMRGKEVCWVPGTDHASIATEAKVVDKLQKEGKTKQSLGRDTFLKHAWEWKKTYGDHIVAQFRRLGLSCDWDRLYFTLDDDLSEQVAQTFIQLYDEGLIYRDTRMVHWDPKGKTALSDEEVIHKEVQGQLYYLRYPLEEGGHVTVATTRPETILGDTALCVHPDDPRYTHLHGKKARVPLTQRTIPIIPDPYVSLEFGTGCLKITPAHDPNDYLLGKKHQLPSLEVIAADGTMNTEAGAYQGLDRMEARKKIVADLQALDQIEKIEPHTHQVGFSERTGAIIEPRSSAQWFVKMSPLAAPALEAVKKGTIQFHPKKFVNLYTHWMENIKDWCISRQLWWGHRIPVYYLPDGRWVVAKDLETALAKARKLPHADALTQEDLTQDPDVLDTWFSSWLCPLSVFQGLKDPKNPELDYYYPTELLVTAPEIIFFWVARMIMAGYHFHGAPPFRNVYFTGIVRDKEGRKMSKSLGNSPDPIALMNQHGADGVRAGMLFCAPAGNDLPFDEALCEQGAHFVHKIKNALRLVHSWKPASHPMTTAEQHAIAWFEACYQQRLQELDDAFATFRLSEALLLLYKVIRNEFCGQYLEMMKPRKGTQISQEAYNATCAHFEALMKLLHPFMPFITEEIWHTLRPQKDRAPLATTPWPTPKFTAPHLLHHATHAFKLLTLLRQHYTQHPAPTDSPRILYVEGTPPDWWAYFQDYLQQTLRLETITPQKAPSQAYRFLVAKSTFWIPMNSEALQQQVHKWQEELTYQQGFLRSVTKKLSNPTFLAQAPPSIVAREKQKEQDAQERIRTIQGWLEKKS